MIEDKSLEKWSAVILDKKTANKRKKEIQRRKTIAVQTAKMVRLAIKSKTDRKQIVDAIGTDQSSFCKELLR